MNASLTTPDIKHITPLVTGLHRAASIDPLVAIIHDEGEEHYKVFIHLYIPDGIIPLLDDNIGEVISQETDAGDIKTRVININYVQPLHVAKSFTLWEIIFCYEATPPMAQAIYVKQIAMEPDEPVTARGTVTTVTYS